MRDLARLALAVVGAALAVSSSAKAQAPAYPSAAPAMRAPAAHDHDSHDHKKHPNTWLHRRSCGHCQRAALMAKGVYVPPQPSPLPPGAVVADGTCAACEAAPVGGTVISETVVSGPYVVGAEPAGRAVIGDVPGETYSNGPVAMSPAPAPIGVMQTNYGGPAAPAAVGAFDPMAHGEKGAAQRNNYNAAYGMPTPGGGAFAAPGSGKPHRPNVLLNVLGLPTPGDFRAMRQARRDRERSQHAMMRMGEQGAPTDLPASMVYGPR